MGWRSCPLEKVPLLARAHARGMMAAMLETSSNAAAQAHEGQDTSGAGVAPGVAAPASRCQVQANQDRGVELRDRALEALALWLQQREPGWHWRAGGAVRPDSGRHPWRGRGGAGGSGSSSEPGHPGHPGQRRATLPSASSPARELGRASNTITNLHRRSAPAASRSSASART